MISETCWGGFSIHVSLVLPSSNYPVIPAKASICVKIFRFLVIKSKSTLRWITIWSKYVLKHESQSQKSPQIHSDSLSVCLLSFVNVVSLCLYFKGSGKIDMFKSWDWICLKFSSFFFFFTLLILFLFTPAPRFSCSKNDQAVHKKLLPLSALDIYTLTHTHTLFTSGLVFNFTSKSGQEAPV